MKDMIREYFELMLEDDISLEGAKENLLEIIEEIVEELEKD